MSSGLFILRYLQFRLFLYFDACLMPFICTCGVSLMLPSYFCFYCLPSISLFPLFGPKFIRRFFFVIGRSNKLHFTDKWILLQCSRHMYRRHFVTRFYGTSWNSAYIFGWQYNSTSAGLLLDGRCVYIVKAQFSFSDQLFRLSDLISIPLNSKCACGHLSLVIEITIKHLIIFNFSDCSVGLYRMHVAWVPTTPRMELQVGG
jgi:hypothetical protein